MGPVFRGASPHPNPSPVTDGRGALSEERREKPGPAGGSDRR
jgi:hypothetical protein